MDRSLVILVHGIGSGPQTWDPLLSLWRGDPELDNEFDFVAFEYSSRLIGYRFSARTPTYRTAGEKLRTTFLRYCNDYTNIAFVTHSQGGLILQTFLSRALSRGEGASLARIRRIVLIACPNEGSGIFLLPRRLISGFWQSAQERRLRPLDEEVADVHQHVARDIARASEVSARSCPIDIFAYAAEEDAIVPPPSAYGAFAQTGVLSGDHFSVLRPTSRQAHNYLELKAQLLASPPVTPPIPSESPERVTAPIRRELLEVPSSESLDQEKYLSRVDSLPPKSNLPQPEHAFFVGREQELESLIQKLLPHERAWLILIDGIGGVGKTALAIEVARQLLQMQSPNGLPIYHVAIWVSAKRNILTADGIVPRHSDMSTLKDLFAAICTVLGRTEVLRLNESEQRAAVRELLSDKNRVLLVVDNLETLDDEHVTTFLRELPQPCKAIVTSRHRIDVAYSIRLEGLRTSEAKELVDHEASRRELVLSDEQKQELIRKTGGIPLAILWSLGLVSLGHSSGRVLERLGSGHSDIIEFCFRESAGAIRGSAAERLLAAAHFLDEEFSRELLGLVAGFGVDEVGRDDALQRLLALSLMNESKGEFSLLPLTRAFLGEYLRRNSTLARSVRNEWIAGMRSLAAGHRGMNAQWRDNSRLAIIGPHMGKAYVLCSSAGDSEDALTFGYVYLLFLDAIGRWDDLLAKAEELVTLAKSVVSPGWVVSMAWLRSWVYGQRGDMDSAAGILDEAEALASSPVDRFQYLLSRSQLRRWSGNFQEASELLDESSVVAESLQGEEGRMAGANILFERGKIARDMNDWIEAKKWFEESAKYFDAEAAADGLDSGKPPAYDIERALGILGNLGYLEYKIGNRRSARELLRRAVVITRRHGPAGNLVTLLQQLAEVELELGQLETASKTLEEALELATTLRAAQELAECRKLTERISRIRASPIQGSG